MKKIIKKFENKINSLKNARNKTVDYINKRIIEKIRILRKNEYRIT
jgi:PHP family Zn ribbon phosphoesterase